MLLRGTFDRALHILDYALDSALEFIPRALSLELLVAGQVPYRLLDLAFVLVDDLAHFQHLLVDIAKTDTNENTRIWFLAVMPVRVIIAILLPLILASPVVLKTVRLSVSPRLG